MRTVFNRSSGSSRDGKLYAKVGGCVSPFSSASAHAAVRSARKARIRVASAAGAGDNPRAPPNSCCASWIVISKKVATAAQSVRSLNSGLHSARLSLSSSLSPCARKHGSVAAHATAHPLPNPNHLVNESRSGGKVSTNSANMLSRSRPVATCVLTRSRDVRSILYPFPSGSEGEGMCR